MKTGLWKKIIRKLSEGYLDELLGEVRWMYKYAKRYWKFICFYIVAGVFSTCMSLGSSLASKQLIDVVTGTSNSPVAIVAAVLVGMAVANIASKAFISRISAKISVDVQNEIQAEIYEKIINTEWESLNEFRSGDLLNRLNSDVSQVSDSVISWFPGLITKLVQFVGTFAIIFYYDPIMACLALLSAPVMFLVSRRLMSRMRKYNKEMREVTGEVMSFQNDSFQNIQTLKAFGLMNLFKLKLEEQQLRYKGKMLDYNKFSVYTSAFLSALGMTVSYVCFGWSAYRLWTGYITTGTMVMFIQMASSLSSAFSSLVQTVPTAISAATCAGRLMAVAELKKERMLDEENVSRVERVKKSGISVELEDVDVGYHLGTQVIHNGSFHARKGEISAIIGPSGEGKTTLVRILLGLIYPQSGTARLLGAEGESCMISAATRDFFSYVPQGNTVFTGTIAENMRMVNPSATDDDIVKALKDACAWEFVEKMPDGIHSKIGEHGAGISEGQAQRIAIARALIKDAPILLLDEATSALDMDIEQRVLGNIMRRGENKTCIVTTHRPSVLSMSDHIYEVKQNRIEQVK